MIERFNFYDIYGYFVPGALLIAGLWVPHALMLGQTPSVDLAAGLAMILGAYVAGHLLQILATKLLPSSVHSGDSYRLPSDLLLDDKNEGFSAEFKQQLLAVIVKKLKIDPTDQSKREEVFRLCRASVVSSDRASYVEQFQGMYVMMRGIAAAAAISCSYDIGWILSDKLAIPRSVLIVFLTIAGLPIVTWPRIKTKDRRLLASVAIVLLAGIVAAGALPAHTSHARIGELYAAAYLSLAIALLTFGSYRAFTWTWARSVYEHFYVSQ